MDGGEQPPTPTTSLPDEQLTEDKPYKHKILDKHSGARNSTGIATDSETIQEVIRQHLPTTDSQERFQTITITKSKERTVYTIERNPNFNTEKILMSLSDRPHIPILRLKRLKIPLINPSMTREEEEDVANSSSRRKPEKGRFRFNFEAEPLHKTAPQKKRICVTMSQVEDMFANSGSSSEVSIDLISDTIEDEIDKQPECEQLQEEATDYSVTSTATPQQTENPSEKQTAEGEDAMDIQKQPTTETADRNEKETADIPPERKRKQLHPTKYVNTHPEQLQETEQLPLPTPEVQANSEQPACLLIHLPPMAFPLGGALLAQLQSSQLIPVAPTTVTQTVPRTAQAFTGEQLTDSELPGEQPSLEMRLGVALTRILTNDYIWKPEEIEKSFPDFWIEKLKELFNKMRAGNSLNMQEAQFFIRNTGYLYHRFFIAMHMNEQADLGFSNEIANEIDRKQLGTPVTRWTCTACEIEHEDGKQCPSRTANGPRLPTSLSNATMWKKQAKAVLIGTKTMFYQPIQGKDTYINLSDLPTRRYRVSYTWRALEVTEEEENSLYKSLKYKLQHLGRNSGLPVFLEYYRNPHHPEAPEHEHVCGFLHVIKALQTIYNSPIVCLIGPSGPRAKETEETYQTRKESLQRLIKMARLIGWALAVPVSVMQVQVLPPSTHGFYQKAHNWQDEPIYNEEGRPIRELAQRAWGWLQKTQETLQPALLSATELDQLDKAANIVHTR